MCFPAVPYYFDLVFDIIELLSIELMAPISLASQSHKKTGVGGMICLVNSVNERDPRLLNSLVNAYALPFVLRRGSFSD